MLERLPPEVWFDPNQRWIEPSAGDGNFLVEIKHRLMQAGHGELHILENMLFSIELIDDNHYTLQHRLGYLVNGKPNPQLKFDEQNFKTSKIIQLTQDLNDKNPYVRHGYARDEVFHHRNHICDSSLTCSREFGRDSDYKWPVLKKRPVRDLGEWLKTDTPDIGQPYVVEMLLGEQPLLQHTVEPAKVLAAKPSLLRSAVDENRLLELIASSWDPKKSTTVNRALKMSGVLEAYIRERGIKKASPELQALVKTLMNNYQTS
jgi:hypothetical protein